jgi:hypothetical protein
VADLRRNQQFAGVAIGVFIRKRLEAAQAITEARLALSPEEFDAWCGQAGLTRRTVADLAAEQWTASEDATAQEAREIPLRVKQRPFWRVTPSGAGK